MPYIYNPLPREKSVCAQGNWFTFKPKQIKHLGSDSLAQFFTSNLSYEGFVRLSDNFEDPSYRLTPDGKGEIDAADAQGLAQRINFLQYIVNNDLNSLRADMEKANDKSDPRLQMSPQMVEQMKELAEYKKKLNDSKKEQVSQIQELEKLINS